MPRRLLPVAALVSTLVLVGAGCGSSDNDKESSSKSTTTTTAKVTTTTETPALDPKDVNTKASPYCATWAEILTAGAPPSNDAGTVKKHYSDLIPTVEKLLSQAPSELESSVQVALDSTRKVAASGSLSDFQRPEVQAAQRKLSDYAAARCKK